MKYIMIFVTLCCVCVGCSVFGGSSQPAEIRFTIQNFDMDKITIQTNDGSRSIQIDRNDFAGTENRPVPGSTDWYRTATKGTIHISIELANEDGEQFSSGEFELDLKKDWRWGVSLRAGDKDFDPLFGCFGCITYYTFEINKDAIQNDSQRSDSLYVIVGGNYISDPVEY